MASRFVSIKSTNLAFMLVLLFSCAFSSPAGAAKKECTNAEKALVLSLRQQIFTLSEQISFFKNQLRIATNKYEASGGGSSHKADMENWTARVRANDKIVQSKEQQILKLTNKCKYSNTIDSTSKGTNLKNCTISEKKAISSVIQNFNGIQSNKRDWDNKANVARKWSQDFSKPVSIRNQASSDFQRFSDLYQQELATEAFVVEQFNLLNSSCKNSGFVLPKPYLTAEQNIDNVNNASGAQIISVEDESRDYAGGPFYITENSDSSFSVNCTKPTWQGINLSNMSLFLVGSISTQPLFVEVFQKKNSPTNWILKPETKLQATLQMGNSIGTMNFNGKFITSNSTSVCGLVTEKLGDLTKNFASDVKSVGLLLKPNESLNSNYINSRYYTYLGGVLLNIEQKKSTAKTISGRSKVSQNNGQVVNYSVHCGVINYLDYVWDGTSEVSKVNIVDESGTVLKTGGSLFPIHLVGNRFEDWYRGVVLPYGSNPADEEVFVKKNFTCEYNLVGKDSIPKAISKVAVPAELIRKY